MIYTGVMVPYDPALSRVSYDPTPLICANQTCGEHVHQPLVVPGEQIGRPGRTYRVIRCLNCLFDAPYFTFFDGDLPIRIEFEPIDGECHHFIEQRKDDSMPNVVSLEWRPGPPDPSEDWSHNVAGGEPNWEQEPVEIDCPGCGKPMEFILQFASSAIDPYFRARDLQKTIYLKIEYYATLYLFACESCNITASQTQCS